MNDEGIVKEVLAPIDGSQGRALIKIGRASACEHCPAGGLCGVKDMEVEARYDLGAFGSLAPGDGVRIDIPVRGGLKAALLMYAVPLALLGAGMAAGIFAGVSELLSFGIGLLLMAAAYYAIHRNNKRFERDSAYSAKITRVISAVVQLESGFGTHAG